MSIPKKYGHGKIDRCPFCQKQATAMNLQNIPVCNLHKNESIDDVKCACGTALDMMHGKYGVFFSCVKCGNMNLRKVLELNKIEPKIKDKNEDMKQKAWQSGGRKEITVRSDDPRYFD